jgi:hypothetical protein
VRLALRQQPNLHALQPPSAVAAGLAYACQYLDDICEVLRAAGTAGQGRPTEVRHVAEAVRTGADPRGPLEALHAALLGAGDPRGVWGAARNLMMTGLADNVPYEPVYTCPNGLCSGHDAAAATAISFTCALTRQPLRKESL